MYTLTAVSNDHVPIGLANSIGNFASKVGEAWMCIENKIKHILSNEMKAIGFKVCPSLRTMHVSY